MARRDESSIPTGRVRRTAKVAGLAGGQTARNYATKATNLARGEDGRRRAVSRRQAEAAEQILDVLGNMKGAAMKVGQVASFIDTGAFPDEFQERIQAKLAELRDSAPRVSFKQMRKVIEDELEAPLGELFAEFDEEAVAAASIGQVYRARLDDGRDVAVKVQYPGVAQAVRSDLQNLGLLMRVAKKIAPGMDAKAMTAEIRERLSDELDYEQEAQAQRAFARAWRDHPFVVIPDVVTSLSRERVLVTEWVDGAGLRGHPEARRGHPRPLRRGGLPVLLRLAVPQRPLLGRPPSGQLQAAARRTRGLPGLRHDEEARARPHRERGGGHPAGLDEDAEGLLDQLVAQGVYPRDDSIDPEEVLRHFQAVISWYLEDREVTIDKSVVSQVLIDFGDPRSEFWQLMKRGTLPPEAILARRMEGLTLGVLGQLGATANWHRIAREWLFGDEPSTPLGEAEADFHGPPRRAAA